MENDRRNIIIGAVPLGVADLSEQMPTELTVSSTATLHTARSGDRLEIGVNAMQIGEGTYKVTKAIFDGGMAVTYKTERVGGTGPDHLIVKQMALTTEQALFASHDTAKAYVDHWRKEHNARFPWQENQKKVDALVADIIGGIRRESVAESMKEILTGATTFDEVYSRLYGFVDSDLGKELRAKAKKQTAEFLREYAILKFLRNNGVSNVPAVYDVVIQSDDPLSTRHTQMHNYYFAQEEAEGESIDSYLSRAGALFRMDAIQVSYALALTLLQVHENGVVHRDVTSNNTFIKMDEYGHIKLSKLIDFGTAVAKYDPAYTALADMEELVSRDLAPDDFRAMGTAEFMAPEVTRVVSRTADSYAFGKLLFFMLTGEFPKPGTLDFLDQLGVAVANGGIDEPLRNIIRNCVRESYRDRWKMDKVVEALGNLMSPAVRRRIVSEAGMQAA